jgi:hypothetical protein
MSIHIWLSVISDIFPILAAIYNYKYLDPVLKIAFCFFIVSLLSDVLQIAFIYLHILTNSPIIHIYIILSILFFGAIYYRAFFRQIVKEIVVVFSVLALFIVIFNIFFNEGILEYPSVSNAVLSILLISFSLMYFYQLLYRQEFIHIEKQAFFWINASVLFYYSVTIFLFMLYKKLSNDQIGQYYIINSITNIIANILFTIGLLCKPQKTILSRY